jgi:hypothetical protein
MPDVTPCLHGDVPAMLLIAGGVLARGDPRPGDKLAWMREAGKVADLGNQPQRGQHADAAEPRQDLHLARPPFAASDLLQALDPVQVDQQLLPRFLHEWIVKALPGEPRAMQLRPRRLALAEDPAVAQQLLEHPITGRQPRAAQIITRTQQISEALELRRRGMREPQHARAVQRGERSGCFALAMASCLLLSDADWISAPLTSSRRCADKFWVSVTVGVSMAAR